MRNLFSRGKHALLFGVSGLGVLGVLWLATDRPLRSSATAPRPELISQYASTVYETCRSNGYPPACYDREIPKTMDVLSMEEAFAVARVIQERDSRYLSCHVLAHYLAERETEKDPTKWKDVVTRCPITMCNNGCPHGALMERFKRNTEDYLSEEQIAAIKPDLADVCEPRGSWHPREIERSMCYHALGHLHMYITNANLRKSAALCREIGVKYDGRNYVQTCTEGVFMSVYQPLGPDDESLVKNLVPTKETMPAFCAPYEDDPMSFHACRKEAWSLFRDEISTGRGVAQFCSYTKDPVWQNSCFASLMNPTTDRLVVNENDFDGLREFCAEIPPAYRGRCFASAAHRLLQDDPLLVVKSLAVCDEARQVGGAEEESCYRSIAEFGALGFVPGSPEQSAFCSKLPGAWQQECLALQAPNN